MSYLLRREEGPSITDGTPTSPRWSGLVRKAYWSLYVLRESRRQRKVPFLPRDTIEEIQRERVRSIIDHAYHTVPYYRSTMGELGLKPSDFQTVQDLTKLPFLTKEKVMKNPRLFLSEGIDLSRCLSLKSSGTTGLHTGVFYDPRSMLFLLACATRELEAIVRCIGKSFFQLRVASVIWPDSPFTHLERFYRSKAFLPIRRLRLSSTDPVEHNVSMINRFRPNVLFGNGYYLSMLFQGVLEGKFSMHFPDALVYMFSHFAENVRIRVEDELGIPVFSTYGSVEAHRIGFTCEERKGFHIHTDLSHVVVEGNGRHQGEIVVSNLVNKAMVLLNYRLGDLVTITDRRCPCGREFPLIGELVGKTDDIINLPGGRLVTPHDIYGVFQTRKDVLDYQVVQDKVENFVIKVIPYKVRDFRQTEEDLQGAFGRLFGKAARVTVEPVDSIPPLPNGKVGRVCALGSAGPTPAEP